MAGWGTGVLNSEDIDYVMGVVGLDEWDYYFSATSLVDFTWKQIIIP